MQPGRELLPILFKERFDGPVLDGPERANCLLAFDDQSQCDSLHASRGQAFLDRLP
jgi:hypothetical protein